jgi:hypothetical protein
MPWKNGNPPLYHVWRSMIYRCYSTKSNQYVDYGGRGIKVCPEWRTNYHKWIQDMGPRPKGTSIDRIDNDGDYTPENCKWSTKKEQQRNQRVTRKVCIAGITYVAADLADIAGIKTDSIVERVNRGLSFKEVISKEKTHNLYGFKFGAAISAKKRREKTHCKNGHEFSPENTRIDGNGKYQWRVCKSCHRIRHSK